MTLSRLEVLRLLEDHTVSPSRALGQNFVADANTVRRIARLAGVGPGDRVVEIGAGLGSLTLALVETGATVTAVEVDRWLVPLLRQVLADKAPAAAVTVVEADAMSLDWTALLSSPSPEPAQSLGGWALVANLPYNIATPLVADLLDEVPAIERMLFMVQQEVAQRLVAGPGSKAYGAVSVKVAYWAKASLVGTVPSSVFVPRPRVGSALVSLKRRRTPAVDPALVAPAQLFSLVRTGFAQRRKMLRRALAAFGIPPEAFVQAGINEESRAEELSVADWGRLAAAAAAGVGRQGAS
ncbi:MAG TPA: 16S rRNA (adenine(1518)-N(6)/adenine(1519)-N(6))-dimethyltransferase RsmA [Acidimicrobiales bacterium]|nr:16S rRNA (adenine(1518)-N(6)/adenine(1519)-N(6))-dimethyltransferase RsmA [Acidimicrobiales bacterium]